MVRILHFADLHIGVENYSRPATDQDVDDLPESFAPDIADRRQTYVGLPTRLLDSLRAFDELVDTAITDQVDLVLFCGDAYRTRDPSQTHQREFARRIGRLIGKGIQVFLLAGNHDLPNAFGRATSIEIFDTLNIRNVTVGSRVGLHRLETAGGAVQVIAVPWMRRSLLAAQEEAKNLSFEQQNEYIQRFLAGSVGQLLGQVDPDVPTVIAAHGTVGPARVGSERSMLLGTDYVLLPGMFQDRRVDYVALGHVHGHQRIAEDPPIVYSGSVHRVDFSEERETKGFVIVDIDPGAAGGRATKDEFRELWSRPFVTINAIVREDDLDPTETVLAAVTARDVMDAIVRVEIALPEGAAAGLDTRRVRHALGAAHAVAGINLNVQRQERTRLGPDVGVQSVTPLEALDLYLGVRDTPAERRETLRRYAAQLISGDDTLTLQTSGVTAGGDDSVSNAGWSARIAGLEDLDAAFAVRRHVFIDEQGIDPSIEWDGKDDAAVHAIAISGTETIGTGRFVDAGERGVVKIGRMAVLPEYRRRGVGATLLRVLEEEATARGAHRAMLHAQTYVSAFYVARGYTPEGERFEEAGIEHIAMWKDLLHETPEIESQQ